MTGAEVLAGFCSPMSALLINQVEEKTMYERLIPQDFPLALAINLVSGEEVRKMRIFEIFFGCRLFYL